MCGHLFETLGTISKRYDVDFRKNTTLPASDRWIRYELDGNTYCISVHIFESEIRESVKAAFVQAFEKAGYTFIECDSKTENVQPNFAKIRRWKFEKISLSDGGEIL